MADIDIQAVVRQAVEEFSASQQAKTEPAYQAVQDGIVRTDDGRLVAHGEHGEVSARDYLTAFVSENPEFLPARISGGSGMTTNLKAPQERRETVDLDKIRPGMSAEEMQR